MLEFKKNKNNELRNFIIDFKNLLDQYNMSLTLYDGGIAVCFGDTCETDDGCVPLTGYITSRDLEDWLECYDYENSQIDINGGDVRNGNNKI